MINTVRALLSDETDSLYYVHTPVGIINVKSWNYALPGFVAITGQDDAGKWRFVVFSEEAVRSFPLEVKQKKQEGSKERLGFKPAPQGDTEDQA